MRSDPTPGTATWDEVPSPIGTFAVAGEGRHVVAVLLPGTWSHAALPTDWRREPGVLAPAAAQLAEYFDGTRREFDLELEPSGTAFQRSVWTALVAIPFGATASYGEVAAAVGNPKASRAVGLANNRNPIALVIPCHRVIGADGSLTGYGGGLEMKTWLLEHERRVLAATAPAMSSRTGGGV